MIENFEAMRERIEETGLDSFLNQIARNVSNDKHLEIYNAYLLPLTFMKDLLWQIHGNNNEILVSKGRAYVHQGYQFVTETHKFRKTEEVIDYFSDISDTTVVIYQVFGFNYLLPESFHQERRIIVECAVDKVGESMIMKVVKKRFEFIKIEEMEF
jgi:hypothetical protein